MPKNIPSCSIWIETNSVCSGLIQISCQEDHIIPTFVTFLNFIAAPEVLQRHHGDVLEGQVHRSVGHGVANRNQPQTRSGKKIVKTY